MEKQLIFILVVLLSALFFWRSVRRIISFFGITQPTTFKSSFNKRMRTTITVAIGQSKILQRPIVGLIHALVFWGFIVITLGSLEMVIDGLFGLSRSFSRWGTFYTLLISAGDIFCYVVLVGICVFLIRRIFLTINRFKGIEIQPRNRLDATIALVFILLLMLTLIGMNTFYILDNPDSFKGAYPISMFLADVMSQLQLNKFLWHEVFWWSHILLILIFANYLPYSKHFHVFLSIPNVFLSDTDVLGRLPSMPSVTKEVKDMLNISSNTSEESIVDRFGVKDIEDVTWKNYLDALTCTQCGRCTDVCPANITGKKLSPRKIFVDLRARMSDKGPNLIKNPEFDDNKSLNGTLITSEEIWACTTCNACASVCPLNIDHPRLILDMRRYMAMETNDVPAELTTMFTNIENNGAPWQFSQEDRTNWITED